MRKKFPIKAIISICCVALIIIVGVVLIVNNSFQPEDSQERDLSELAFDNLDMDAPVTEKCSHISPAESRPPFNKFNRNTSCQITQLL